MGTSSPGEHLDRAIRHRLASRASSPKPPPPDPSDHAVHDAEQIVSDSWVQVLIEHKDQAHAALNVTSARCDDARRHLSAVLLERVPKDIVEAHTQLEAALAAVRQASHSYELAHTGLVLELDRLAWRNIERRADARIAREDEPKAPPRSERPTRPSTRLGTVTRFFRRVLPWCLYAVVGFAAGARTP
jgi:hypothetical protein